MNHEDLRKIVLDSLLEVAPDVEASALDPAQAFRDQFDFDSMDYLNFVIALHHHLGVDIPESDYPQLASLDGAVRYLEPRLSESAAT
jgi:acyl carrier protein